MHLYVHVPFCRSKCAYCGFASQPPAPGEQSAYVRALLLEMDQSCPQMQDEVVQTVFFGGGTPSLLRQHDLARILEAVHTRFRVAPGAEITLEANPDSVCDRHQVRAWQQMGVNRVSLGVQSLDAGELWRLGRRHTPQQAVRAAHCLAEAGMDNWGLDLIWGIPGQGLDSWLRTLKRALALEPAHLSMYGLTLEPGTELARQVDNGELVFPDEDRCQAMFLQGRERLIQAGLEHYEISNLARTGRQCRHNLGIWQGQDYLGLGPAAVSTVHGSRRQNPSDIRSYVQRLDSGQPVATEEVLSDRDRERERIMLGLRTAQGIRTEWLLEPGCQSQDRNASLLRDLQQAGLIQLDQGALRLTAQGMLVSNEILALLI